jgi:hypothetical protein
VLEFSSHMNQFQEPALSDEPEGHPSSPSVLPIRLDSPLRVSTSLHPLIHDPRAVARLLEEMLQKGGVTISGAAKALDISPQAIRQYIKGPRRSPGLQWFLKLAELCGCRVLIEFPSGDRRF